MDISNVFDKVTPLSQEPPDGTGRKVSNFSTSLSRTYADLERELRMLGAQKGTRVLELCLPDSRIRQDGFPYANAHPAVPYVAIRFRDREDRDQFWDAFQYRDWRDNLRAIALSLESLRRVDRYGVARGRQYAGFLPPGSEMAVRTHRPVMSPQEAAQTLFRVSGGARPSEAILDHRVEFQTALRRARAQAHPDRGGSTEVFHQVQEAAEVLEAHHR